MAALFAAAFLSAATAAAQTLEGRWEGTLRAGDASLRLLLDITTTDDDLHLGTLTSVDQAHAELPIDVIELEGDRVSFEIRTIGARYQGHLDDRSGRLRGSWNQGSEIALEFVRYQQADERSEVATVPGAVLPDQGSDRVPEPFGVQLQLDVPFVPPAFRAHGGIHVAYELHLTNFGFNPIALRRIDVLAAEGGEERILARFERAELNALLRSVGTMRRPADSQPRIADLRQIPPGRRAVAFLWITIDDGESLPEQLQHRLTVRDQVISGATLATRLSVYEPLDPPLAGDDWLAVNGPGNASIHRRAIMALDGRARIAQRFAIDWVRLDERGSTFAGNPEDNASYYAYGAEVLAVADATVVSVQDGIVENVPGLMSRAVPITLDTLAGNHVVLDVGDGRYAVYAHLQPGSLRVALGDRVGRGEVLGLVGNSGNSTEPHLHFHVADGPTLASEGLPYAFTRFTVRDAQGNAEPRVNDLPLQNAIVRFPD